MAFVNRCVSGTILVATTFMIFVSCSDRDSKSDYESRLEEEARVQEIEKKLEAQRLVIKDYVGTEYEELSLKNGRVLKSVTVSSANAIGVSFMHEGGVARVKFSDLSQDVRDACMYDVELAAFEEQKQKEADNRRMIESLVKKSQRKDKKSSSAISDERPKEIIPRGKITVRVVGSGSKGKKLEIKALSNVNGTITLDGVYVGGFYITKNYRVTAKKPFYVEVNSVKNKYTVELKGGGKTLDTESSISKSGFRERNSL